MCSRTIYVGRLRVVVENVDESVSDEELKKMVLRKLFIDGLCKAS